MATRPPIGLPKLPRRGKILLSIVVGLILILIIGARLLGAYVDWLWFGEVGFHSVFSTILVTRVVLFFVLGLLVGGVFAVSIWVAYRMRPVFVPVSGADDPLARYRSTVVQRVRLIGIGLPVLVGLIAGWAAQSDWQVVQLFLHSTSFGIQDPEFHLDVGFYAFKLPFYTWLIGWLFVTVVVAFFGALITHYLFGGIRLANKGGQLATPARVQLSVTAGVFVLIYAVSYFFERYELLSDDRNSLFTGATYTDLNAVLPAKLILLCISVFCAIAFFAGAFLRNLQLPAIATVLLVLSSILIGTAWPLVLQQFSVKPNESAKEQIPIQRNMDATRQAFGLGPDKVEIKDYPGTSTADLDQLQKDAGASNTISNVRLLDPNILAPTFTQQQATDNVYGFPAKLDVDRYTVDNQLRDYVVAAREINTDNLAENQRSWINRHVVYTHGNGFVAAAANTVDEAPSQTPESPTSNTTATTSTRGGYPIFTVSDLNSMDSAKETKKPLPIPITEPRVYYGELATDYAIVGAPREYDGQNRPAYEYTGTGGVPVGSLFKRLVFAADFTDRNILFSGEIKDNSRIMYNRDPKTRVSKVAPWLTLDNDPYPAVVGGRIQWIVDGYTTLENYPYAQKTQFGQVTSDSLNSGPRQEENISYIRNSVKAVVDSFNGSVTLYAVDETDPVLKAWEGVFPGTVKPTSAIPPELATHFRYPEDLFKVQRDLLARYHVGSPQEFFSTQTFWDVPPDPTVEGGSPTDINGEKQPPYYVVAQTPEQSKPTFQVTSALTSLKRQFLASWVSVSSDPDDYGKIKVLRLPQASSQVDGPIQVQNNFQGSFTADRTLLQNQQSTVKFGNLLTLPVANGLIYVEPIYIQQKAANAFPQLARVLVAYGKKIGFSTTLGAALDQVFGPGADELATQPSGSTPPPSTGTSTPPTSTTQPPNTQPGSGNSAEMQAAANDMASAFQRLKAAQAKNDYEGVAKAFADLDAASKRYDAAKGKTTTTTTTTTKPPPTSGGG
ncbi:UPF0182 family protein [Labedaea rhizosphaerae]|uniref:UPF0182 protein EV186_11630 n=1 Tax=Labedaea rhizosphaerae TaxID=598644 RepID=A0A4R6RQD3_LABRH|nr:UPF0182 family protein [Labedaea rhizosphaerae]TDP88983.1 hypothetical protein EV186_11630 [Labedaea rhizosphaerae]